MGGIIIEESIPMGEICSFTLESYVKLLCQLKKIYKIIPFCELPQQPPYIILRHDVDISPLAALKMAKIEHDLGIRSTYFISFSSKFYNVFDKENIGIIRAINKLGHEIGLHYDPYHFKINGLKPINLLEMQIKVLETLTGKIVRTVVRHGPWTDRDPFAAIKGYINADHPYYLGDLGIHDSLKAWTPPDGLIKLFKKQPKRVQILIHPENWTKSSIDRESTLRCFFEELYNKYQCLEKEMRKTWLSDHNALEYDRLVDILKKYNIRIKPKEQPMKSNFLRNIAKNMRYYKNYCVWYLINSKVGWQMHTTLENIRKTLKLQ